MKKKIGSYIVTALSIVMLLTLSGCSSEDSLSANVYNQSGKKIHKTDGTYFPNTSENNYVKFNIKTNKSAKISYDDSDLNNNKVSIDNDGNNHNVSIKMNDSTDHDDGTLDITFTVSSGKEKVKKDFYVENIYNQTKDDEKAKKDGESEYSSISESLDKKGNSDNDSSNSPQSKSSSSSATAEDKNALAKAKDYLTEDYLSEKGLYDQLTSKDGEGFTDSEAQYAIDQLNNQYNIDWDKVALEKAKMYEKQENMSKNDIYDQLVSTDGEQFTAEQAQYAVNHLPN